MATDPDTHEIAPETFAEHLSNRYLRCRELGHQWRPRTVAHDTDARCYVRTLACVCGTERRQVLTERGGILTNSYAYPDGYMARNVAPGFSRDVFRLESITRYLENG